LPRTHIPASIARQGSALSYYLMPHAPVDLHDILDKHDFERDVQLRRALIDLGVFFVTDRHQNNAPYPRPHTG